MVLDVPDDVLVDMTTLATTSRDDDRTEFLSCVVDEELMLTFEVTLDEPIHFVILCHNKDVRGF